MAQIPESKGPADMSAEVICEEYEDVLISDMGTEATQPVDVELAIDQDVDVHTPTKSSHQGARKRCTGFKGSTEAKGLGALGSARGAIVMSNIYMSTALLYLASDAAGCVNNGSLEADCRSTIYGFLPSSLIASIATVSGVLSALFMPLIGAIIDFTPYRRMTGIASAGLILSIQALQIYTVSSTWFPMLILQAIAGFLYQVQVLAVYSYFPGIATAVGQKTMTNFTAKFQFIQFGSESLYLLLIIGISLAFHTSDVVTCHISQNINCLWIIIGFCIGWNLLPSVPRRHSLPPDRSFLTAGFIQTWNTTKNINKHYGTSLRWFFLAVMFAEAGANAFTVLSVTFMYGVLNMSGTEIGIMFLLVLIASLPGTKFGEFVTRRTNPNTSWKICLGSFAIVTAVASGVLVSEERKPLVYLFGVVWGIILGWYYPVEDLIFSLTCPKGQEAELSGFYVYSTQILVWLPPIIFTSMNESGISMNWGLTSLAFFLVVAICFLHLMPPWEEVIKGSKNVQIVEVNDNTDSEREMPTTE